MELIVIIIAGAVALFIGLRALRRDALMRKHSDKALVDRLMNREIWEGQTQDLLIDSIGKPIQIDQKFLKAKTRETWKYDRRSRHRFGLRVSLENGVVIGWDQKH